MTSRGRSSKRNWVWVFGAISAFDTVVANKRMGFPVRAARRVALMGKGDQAILYLTRGAFRNPTRDRSRVAAAVTLSQSPGSETVTIGEQEYPYSVPFKIERLIGQDVRNAAPAVEPVVGKLELVRRPEVWGQYFRNTPIQISDQDFTVLARMLR